MVATGTPIAIATTAWLATTRSHVERSEALVVLIFTGAALASVYPRFDYGHMLYAAPVLLVGAAYALWHGGRAFELRRVEYDNEKAAAAYEELGPPFGEFAAKRIRQGSD